MVSRRDITALLGEWSRGSGAALAEVLPLVYAELRRVAARQLRNERADHTLQPTALGTRCTCGSSTNAASIGRIEPTFLVSPRSSCAESSLITSVVTAPSNGEGVRSVSIDAANDLAIEPHARPRVRSRAPSVGND